MPDELLRAAHLRNSASHSHTMGLLPHFMRLNFFTLAWSNIKIMMPDELLRAAHLRNSASHSHTMGPCPTLCSCLGGFQSQMSPFVQARGATDFFTLAS